MTLPERLQVILELKGDRYKREVREVASATGKVRQEIKQTGSATGQLNNQVNGLGGRVRTVDANMKQLARGAGALFIGGVLTRGVSNAINRAEQLNSAYKITEQIIDETGGAANVTAEEIKQLSKEQSILTGVDKALVTEGNNVLLTFKNIRNEVGEGNNVFERASALMLDVGAVMGTDARSGALQLGKALNDPLANMGALSRAGLQFSEQQKEQIRNLIENNNLLGAQRIILDELESQLGGTAAASADASDKISNSVAEIGEAFGQLALPFLETAAIELQRIVGLTDELDRYAAITGQARDSGTLLAGALLELGNEFDHLFEKEKKGAEGLDDFEDDARELIQTADLTGSELQKVRDGLDFLVDVMGLSAEQAKIVADILDRELNVKIAETADEVLIATQRAKHFDDSLDGVQDTADGTDLSGARDEFDKTGSKAVTVAGQIDEIDKALRRLTDPVFKAVDDARRLREAEQAFLDLLADEKSTLEDRIEAGFDLAEAQQAANESAHDLPDNIGSATEAILLLGTEAGVTDEILTGMKETIDGLDGVKSRAEIELRLRSINEIVSTGTGIESTGAVRETILSGAGRYGLTHRQHGGPVDGPFIAGEAGRELVVPTGSATVLPNQMTEQILAAMSRGGVTHQHHYHIGALTDQTLEDLQRRQAINELTIYAETP